METVPQQIADSIGPTADDLEDSHANIIIGQALAMMFTANKMSKHIGRWI